MANVASRSFKQQKSRGTLEHRRDGKYAEAVETNEKNKPRAAKATRRLQKLQTTLRLAAARAILLKKVKMALEYEAAIPLTGGLVRSVMV